MRSDDPQITRSSDCRLIRCRQFNGLFLRRRVDREIEILELESRGTDLVIGVEQEFEFGLKQVLVPSGKLCQAVLRERERPAVCFAQESSSDYGDFFVSKLGRGEAAAMSSDDQTSLINDDRHKKTEAAERFCNLINLAVAVGSRIFGIWLKAAAINPLDVGVMKFRAAIDVLPCSEGADQLHTNAWLLRTINRVRDPYLDDRTRNHSELRMRLCLMRRKKVFEPLAHKLTRRARLPDDVHQVVLVTDGSIRLNAISMDFAPSDVICGSYSLLVVGDAVTGVPLAHSHARINPFT